MKKTSITITWEEDKLSALRLYLAEKQVKVEDALVKALNSLYAKAVPQPVQHFLELRGSAEESAATPKPKPVVKPKPKQEADPNGK